jgi:hypothetical protein
MTFDELIDVVEVDVSSLAKAPMPEPGADVDAVGRLRTVRDRLSKVIAGLEAEMDPSSVGDEYRQVEQRRAKRSYNTARLIDAFGEAGLSMQQLIRDDVLRLSWQWTPLRRVASQAGVTLAITPNEVLDDGDLDGPMVGEVWSTSYKVEPKEAL